MEEFSAERVKSAEFVRKLPRASSRRQLSVSVGSKREDVC